MLGVGFTPYIYILARNKPFSRMYEYNWQFYRLPPQSRISGRLGLIRSPELSSLRIFTERVFGLNSQVAIIQRKHVLYVSLPLRVIALYFFCIVLIFFVASYNSKIYDCLIFCVERLNRRNPNFM